ncbi:MAG: hypothetical protein K2M13_03050 [Muribaculaceae bacterium]|nr:hypothetical protein [Muribaculaceae bacterium]
MSEYIFKHSFLVSANEANPEGELAVTILVSNLIEVATRAAMDLNIGNPVMAHLNAGWVLSRLTIELSRYPKVNTYYSIETWVESWNRHFSVRCFEIKDGDGVTVGYARSVWMVLNTETHENFGLGHLSLPEGAIKDKDCPIARQEKHVEIVNEGETGSSSSSLSANTETLLYTFRYNDIDFYRHVNTVRYVSLLLNSYSLEEFDKSFIRRLELSFLHEGNFDETVEIRRFNHDSSLSSFSLFSTKKNLPILFARIGLEERSL